MNDWWRQASLDNLEYWLRRGVDGFRLDAVNFCMHDPQLHDNPPKPADAQRFLSGPGASPYAMQEHRFDHTHPNNLLFMEDIRRLLDRYGALALGEIGSDCSAGQRRQRVLPSLRQPRRAAGGQPLERGQA